MMGKYLHIMKFSRKNIKFYNKSYNYSHYIHPKKKANFIYQHYKGP